MLLGVYKGVGRAGVGICRIGNGKAAALSNSVTPGILGMSGGREYAAERLAKAKMALAPKLSLEKDILKKIVGKI
jgi:hypothetical protein